LWIDAVKLKLLQFEDKISFVIILLSGVGYIAVKTLPHQFVQVLFLLDLNTSDTIFYWIERQPPFRSTIMPSPQAESSSLLSVSGVIFAYVLLVVSYSQLNTKQVA